MTRKERKSNESRLSNNIKRTATTVIITAAVVGSIGITNSVRAEEKDVNITSSNSVDTTTMSGGSTSVGESSSVSTSPISTNSITVSSLSRNKEESPKPEALTSNTGSESNSATTEDNSSDKLSIQGNTFDSRNPLSNGGVTINSDKETDKIKLEPLKEKMTGEKINDSEEKKKLIDDALKKLEELKDLPEEKRKTVKTNIEGDGVGTISLEKLKNNLNSILELAKQQDESARKEKKEKLIDDALKKLEELKDLPEEKRQAVKDNIEGDKVGKINLEDLERNLNSILEKAKQQDELARKEKEKNNNPKSNKEMENEKSDESAPEERGKYWKNRMEIKEKISKVRNNRDEVSNILRDRIDGLDETTKNNIIKLLISGIDYLSEADYDKTVRELLDGLSVDKDGPFSWDGIKNNPQSPMVEPEKPKDPEKPSNPEAPKKDKEDKPPVKPKAEPKSPKEKKPEVEKKIEKKPEAKMPETNKPKVEKKPEAKMPKENKPKIEEKKNEKPKVMAPNANKDSLKPRVIEPKSDSKEKTENKKPENNNPEMKKPEMKSPQKDDMNKKGDSNKNKMNEAPKKENNKNRMSDKTNEAPKNIKKKMLPQMGIQHSIATSLMGLSSLVGAALILFKKNDK
ncbi:MAG: hypothetical protein SPG13_06405 [Peptostreptococcus porci]|uniref:Uncharacterized protein n=1 Tax=Peptostreptococcus porci TaxID=2652282 RepID=A0A6N7X0I5_9FIRM|nr:hypothetical protein [Peptostreptococcus porci]MDY5480083.1 hypothetical protein [Peptostreptococcus porci]MST62480.1 hypothetical protein [Peptostreptococcus porci]